MIGIVDYGVGNIRAFANTFRKLDIPFTVLTDARSFQSVDRIVLPGVGAFDWAMKKLNSSGMRDALEESVHEKCKPVLGVCVGMHMMADGSDEGKLDGLNWIPGHIHNLEKLSPNSQIVLPHMGWNSVDFVRSSRLFDGLVDDARFYFLHSYFFAAESEDAVLVRTTYAQSFAVGVISENIYGVQFHPEKSHGWGAQLLANFAGI